MTDEKAREVLQKLIDKCAQEGDAKGIIALSHAIKTLEQQPKQGHWIGETICSNCNYTKGIAWKFNYCPECGIDMRGDKG